ncbi:MAG: amidase, partial [Myxococcota bacterium]
MPRPSPPTLTWSAVALARAIRTQQTTAQAVVEAHIDRVKQVNPIINAVVHARFTQALEEAREADAQVAQAVADKTVGELPPLLGVPCTIKECFGLEGMPQTSGLVSRRGVFAERDATAVRRLRDAGAIPLGVTNISELCMWMESHNRVYGRTRNPYDPSRIVGGSSGGEGAIVASGASPFGLGSDIGGSIRMPAFFNGVFGHKPTGGMVPSTGQWPIPPDSEPLRCLGTGPLARCAEDLMPLLRLMAGPDGEDASTQPWSLGDPNAVSVEGMTVISVEGNGFRPVARDLLQAQRRVARMLAQRGARVVHMQFEPLKQSLQMWAAMMNDAQGPKFRVLLGGGTPARLRRNFARYL